MTQQQVVLQNSTSIPRILLQSLFFPTNGLIHSTSPPLSPIHYCLLHSHSNSLTLSLPLVQPSSLQSHFFYTSSASSSSSSLFSASPSFIITFNMINTTSFFANVSFIFFFSFLFLYFLLFSLHWQLLPSIAR